jgi:hypothetical protein
VNGKEETMKQHSDDQVIPYPKARRFMEEAIRSTHHKPMMHGLLESMSPRLASTCGR